VRAQRQRGVHRRLPQELRLHGISTLKEANVFLREEYVAEFNQRLHFPNDLAERSAWRQRRPWSSAPIGACRPGKSIS
jgi:hypothetical protein